MSKKTTLINILNAFKSDYESVQSIVDGINKSMDYTESGKQQVIKQELDKFAPAVQRYHDNALNIIDTGLEALSEKWRKNSTGKLLDPGYQAGLANVIKMLEIGAIQEREDIQNIIDTYSGDFNALAVIRNILQKSKAKELAKSVSLVPVDNRGENKRLLMQLRKNIDESISTNNIQRVSKSWNTFNQGRTDVSVSMDGMVQFVNTRLNDDLSLK